MSIECLSKMQQYARKWAESYKGDPWSVCTLTDLEIRYALQQKLSKAKIQQSPLRNIII